MSRTQLRAGTSGEVRRLDVGRAEADVHGHVDVVLADVLRVDARGEHLQRQAGEDLTRAELEHLPKLEHQGKLDTLLNL